MYCCVYTLFYAPSTHTRTHARTHACTHARTHSWTRAHTLLLLLLLLLLPPLLLLLLNSYMFFQTRTKRFSVLHNVRAGSRIGVEVDTHRHLHVLLDGEDLGVAAPDTPLTHPCYALFDLGFWLKKVCICMTCRTSHRTAKKVCICTTCM